MGFFDSVLDDTATKGVISTPVATKKEDQDGSFLIIDDSMKAESLPDTAVQIFDTTPSVTTGEGEISFFSSPAEPSSVSKAEFLDDSNGVSSDASVSSEPALMIEEKPLATEAHTTPETVTLDVAVPETSVVTEISDSASIQDEESTNASVGIGYSEQGGEKEVVQENSIDASDIYAPMKRAIAEYEGLRAVLMKSAKEEDEKIVNENAKIAEAKKIAKLAIDKAQASAKEALEKRKSLDAEMKRIEEMSNLLALQIK